MKKQLYVSFHILVILSALTSHNYNHMAGTLQLCVKHYRCVPYFKIPLSAVCKLIRINFSGADGMMGHKNYYFLNLSGAALLLTL